MKGLYSIRQRLGITQLELGERVGIDSNTISRYERGQLNATNKTTLKIAQELGVSVDELINGPSKDELRINILWEVSEEMNELMIKPNEFNVGYRSDGMYLLWGALPYNMTADEIVERIRREVLAAEAGKEAREKKLKALDKD